MLKTLTEAPAVMSAAVFFLLLFCVYPFILLVYQTFFSSGSFETALFLDAVLTESTVVAIKNTLWISACTGLVSLLIALPMAWLMARSDLPYARKLRSYFCLPYAIPPYIGAIAWIYLANPNTGLLNGIFGNGFFNIYSASGLIWVMSSFFYTFILLSLLAAMDRLDPAQEEAARLSGAGPLRVFFQITLPLITPALLSGVLLVVLEAAASFGVPALIGNPARIYLITTKIYTLQKMGSISGVLKASAISIILLLTTFFILWFAAWISKRYSFQTLSGKSSRPTLVSLGRWRWPIFIFLMVIFAILFVLPVMGILITSLNKVQGTLSWSNLGLQNYSRVFFEMDETHRALWNSTWMAAVSATLATALGLMLAYIQIKTRYRGRQLLGILSDLPYSTPGTVIALALILAFSGSLFFGIIPSLYNTFSIIILAYFVKYLSFALRTSADGISQIDNCLAEASRVAGATWLQSIRTIWVPLMKPSLVAAWFLIFMPSFSELTMTILLSGPGMETVGTFLFELQEYSDTSGGGAAVLALVVITSVATINGLTKWLSNGKYGL